jgi:hypothetical protein
MMVAANARPARGTVFSVPAARCFFAVCGFMPLCVPTFAQEDELSRIPAAVQGQSETVTIADYRAPQDKYSVENVFTLASYRTHPAVAQDAATPGWADRTSLDAMGEWKLTDTLHLNLSDRLSATFGDGLNFPRQAMRNDLREAYLSWEATPLTYIDAGRINVRSGVAVGYNPTDFFKSRTAVAQVSADPSAARDNRLGTLMLRAQRLWDGGSLTFVYAPKTTAATPLGAGGGDGFGPHFDHTNAAHRFLLGYSFEAADFSPQLLVYHEGGRTTFGANLSHPIGNSIVAYAEWSGGVAPSLIADAVACGKKTGTLPAFVPVLPPAATGRAFRSDVSAGASWTGEHKESLYLEYHYSQGAMSDANWHDWFAAGGADPNAAREVWYVRGFASDQGRAAARHEIFLRANWDDVFVNDLSLGVVGFAALRDGSGYTQAYASYDLSDQWSFSAYAGGSFGGKRTIWGSLNGAASYSVRLARYL